MLRRLDPRHWLARCVRCGFAGGELCARCLELPLVSTHTAGGLVVHGVGRYAGHLAECLRRLKYQDETHLAFPLGRALRALAVRSGLVASDAIVLPVPLHPMRLAERGYNQSALIARKFASPAGVRVVTSCLFRAEMRTAQALLSGPQRRSNLIGAFRATALRSRSALAEVYLLDDVVTTGSTVDACALALQSIGIGISGVLACAVAGDAQGAVEAR